MMDIYLCQTEKLLPLFEEELKFKEGKAKGKPSVALLSAIFCEKLNTPLPDIDYTAEGKPYFPDSSVSFSVSHSGELLAIALDTEGRRLGIDIQEELDSEEREARLHKRYGKYLDSVAFCKSLSPTSLNDSLINLLWVESDGCGNCLRFNKLALMQEHSKDGSLEDKTGQKSLPSSYISCVDVNNRLHISKATEALPTPLLHLWTRTEAVLKAEGIGLGGLCGLSEYSRHYKLCTFDLYFTKRDSSRNYSLSIAY